MTGTGIGRFANRKAAKTMDGAPSNAKPGPLGVDNIVAMETNVGHSREEDVWTDTGQDVCNNDHMDHDLSFSDFQDSASFGGHELEMSFHKTSFSEDPFVRRESDLQFDEESLPPSGIGKTMDISVGATTSVSIGTAPTRSSGFSRFSNKNKTPTADDNKRKIGHHITNDENTTRTSTIAKSPNHAEDNDVVMDESGCNNLDDAQKTNASPTQSQKTSPPLVATTYQPPVAMELNDMPRQQMNKEWEKSRRVSFEDPSSLPKDPFPRSGPGEKPIPQGRTNQDQYENQHQEGMGSKFSASIPNIVPGSRGDHADPPRTPNGIPMNAIVTEASLLQQQHRGENESGYQLLQRERFANVTDNRVSRKKGSRSAAVTPNPPKTVGLATESGVANSQKDTTNVQKVNDLFEEADDKIDILDNFEHNQAKFLTNIRETEDLQERIEMDLLDMNVRFSEHYALLLGDLDVAVELVDKLEDIEKLANETLAKYQQTASNPIDTITERLCGSGSSSSGESKSDP